jgi:hypothetical protein
MISPADFIPVAERTHIVWDLDRMMLEKACGIAKDLQKAAGAIGRKIYVSVNLSGAHFDAETIVDEIASILKSTGAPAIPGSSSITRICGAISDDPTEREVRESRGAHGDSVQTSNTRSRVARSARN